MAKGNAVWGIDIGQCSLKALRCTYDSKTKQLVADACDFIEYEKILSQPDANPEALIRDALKEFLSRNNVRGDGVAISVAGQQGLARFIKLPPVEAKKLPKIVEYEAKTQIPFQLEDVIWDYQMLVGGTDADGMALENEVGLFAMKRDQVFRAIEPLDDAGVELDVVQLSPVCVLNTAIHDVLGDLPPLSEIDSENPPKSIVVLSMGTDTTDLVVTNGYRIWQRSIPLGGNHFTKQLTKELKLTFGKAEHLKRNSQEADDPKKVFQAMRPVFNDLVTEIQRSIGFFQSLDRDAEISHIVGLGNAFKLPGLEPYLEKNLEKKVKVLGKFKRLEGSVLQDPKYKKNAQSMGVCYGLALQGLTQAKVKTNLVPREIVRARMIRRKKPWVLAASALLMGGLAMNYALHSFRTKQVDETRYEQYVSTVGSIKSRSKSFIDKDTENVGKFEALKAVGDKVVGNSDRRFQMLELLKAIETALPREPGLAPGQPSKRKLMAETYDEQRVDLFIERMDMKYYGGEEATLADWFDENAQAAYGKTLAMMKAVDKGGLNQAAAADGEASGEGEEDADADTEEDVVDDESGEEAALEGGGWVVELEGYHFHNLEPPMFGSEYVKRTLVRNLMAGKVRLPVGKNQFDVFEMSELGITHVLIAKNGQVTADMQIDNPDYVRPKMQDDYEEFSPGRQASLVFGGATDTPAKPKQESVPEKITPPVHRFIVQFAWRPKRLSERLEARGNAAAGNVDPTADEGGN